MEEIGRDWCAYPGNIIQCMNTSAKRNIMAIPSALIAGLIVKI